MTHDNGDDADETNRLAESLDIPYRVRVSRELSEQLKPNEFLAGLGIRYLERIKTVLGILKGNMILKQDAREEALPQRGGIIPLTLVKGPFIKEELISIRAEAADDEGEKVILLTSILEE